MWISRAMHTSLIEAATQEARLRHASEGREAELRRERTEMVAIRAYLETENRQLRERLIEAEAQSRSGQAVAAVWAIRLNQLQTERDQLFIRLVPGVEIFTPHVTPSGAGAVLEPTSVNFEHDPEGAAPAPDPITVPDDDGFPLAPGMAYDPFADVRDRPPTA